MLWKLSQRTFNGGQLDKRLMGRTDLAKYYEGASVLENFIVKRQGCIVKRRGTVQVADFTAATGCASVVSYRLVPFTFENSYGYVLAFVEDRTNGRRCFVFSKAGAVVASLAIPYPGSDFAKISYDQSGDMVYLAHQSHPFARITRYAEDDWRYETINFATCGHESLPATPVVTAADLLPEGKWTGTGPEKTVYYIVTAVRDGIESRASDPYAVTYKTPWPDGCSIKITIAQQTPEPDYYNIYKKDYSYTGLIGTTSSGLVSGETSFVDTLPSSRSGVTSSFGSKSMSSPAAVSPENSRSRTDASPNGFLVADGVYTVTYGEATDADSFSLSLGYAWYCGYTYTLDVSSDINSQYINRHYVMYLPCDVATVKAVVTFDDGTTQNLGSRTVPSSVKTAVYDRSIASRSRTPDFDATTQVEEKRKSMSKGVSLTWTVQNRGTKKVKSVTFTAYSSGTNVAEGGITFGRFYDEDNVTWPQISGNPFVISGFWAQKTTTTKAWTYIDEYITADASLTPPKYEPFFDDTGEFPGCVALYQQRLALAKTRNQPFTFWLSCIGDLYNFNTHESLREDDAMEVTLPATKYPDINHMILNRDLIMFCDSGEWVVSSTTGAATTYKTIATKVQSQIGCSDTIKPVTVGDDVVFANMTDETLVATKYSYSTDGYETTDLSVLSQDIFRGNAITSLAYKQHPDSILVATLADGTLATLEYMKEHEVVAWSRHALAGGLKALYCCADGSTTDGTTDVYVLAQDTAANGQQLILLRVKEDATLTRVSDAVSMDQMTTVSGAGTVPAGFVAVNVLTGEELAEGASRDAGATYVQGRPFTARFVSVKPEPNAKETVRFEVKNPTEVEICVNEGSTLKVGQYGLPEDRDRTVRLPPSVDPATGAIKLQTADKATLVTGANNRDGRIRVTSDSVWPLTILSISTTYQVETANQEPQKARGGGGDEG